MREALGLVKKFGHWDFRFGVGERTPLSISGREYSPTEIAVKLGDLVTVDVSPVVKGRWGDCARSYVVSDDQTFLDPFPVSGLISEGLKAEHTLHNYLTHSLREETTFEEVYFEMNAKIEELGFRNLDFHGNLGHSIEVDIDHRKYLERGEKTKLNAVDLFTFEPHIQHKAGGPGFKRENIYFFKNGQIQEL